MENELGEGRAGQEGDGKTGLPFSASDSIWRSTSDICVCVCVCVSMCVCVCVCESTMANL